MPCPDETKHTTGGLEAACIKLAAAYGPRLSVLYRAETPSTNTLLKQQPSTNATGCGLLAVTDYQSAGRGTRGREWVQQPGLDLAFSLAFSGSGGWAADPRLSLAVAALVARALRQELDRRQSGEVPLALRWANDVLAGAPPRKCCGILLECSGGRVIIGIGINVNSTAGHYPPELRPRLTSLSDATGAATDRPALLELLCHTLLGPPTGFSLPPAWAAGLDSLLQEWSGLDCTPGTRYRLHREGRVLVLTAESVDRSSGELVCRAEDGSRVLVAGYNGLERLSP